MKRIVTFGEILLRLSPDIGGFWQSQQHTPMYLGGAELNVARALSRWGFPTRYVSRMPANSMATAIREMLQAEDIDVRALATGGLRIGQYWLPQGTDIKSGGVIYDRAHSSFGTWTPEEVDWETVFQDAGWFHFSAITPALSPEMAKLCRVATQEAAQRNIPQSVDLNYRATLWQYGVPPQHVMPELVEHCQLIMGNLWAAHHLLGAPLPEVGGQDYPAYQETTNQYLFLQHPTCQWIAHTYRFDHPEGGIQYHATLSDRTHSASSPTFRRQEVVDRVGSGDCFMAGLLAGITSDWSTSKTVSFAAMAAIGKLGEKGDATQQSIEQIFSNLSTYS